MPPAQEGGTGGSACATFTGMDDFPIIPPIIVKETPKPRRITTIKEARDYVDEAMRLGRPASWREVWHRIKMVTGENKAIEAPTFYPPMNHPRQEWRSNWAAKCLSTGLGGLRWAPSSKRREAPMD
jgi:hypothetical protein